MSNYGDDLFSIVSILGAQRYWANYNPKLLCPQITKFDANYGYPFFFPDHWFQYNNPIGQFVRLTTLISNVLSIDQLIFSGGSIFNSGKTGVRNLVYWADRRGITYSAIGVSIGPYKTKYDEEKVKTELKRFSYISTRDKVSYERACSYNLKAKIVESADLAGVIPSLINPEGSKEVVEHNSIRIGFSPCYLSDHPDLGKIYCDMFVNAVQASAIMKPIFVNVICLNQHYKIGDVGLCIYTQKELLKKGILSNLIFYNKIGVVGTWRLISNLDAYFSVRMHGAITAYLCDVPFFLFEYHEKCSEFLDFIGKFSQERMPIDTFESDYFLGIFERVIRAGNPPLLSLHSYCELSERNFLASPMCNLQ